MYDVVTRYLTTFKSDDTFSTEYTLGLYLVVNVEVVAMIYLQTSVDYIWVFERLRSRGLYTDVLSIDILAE